MTDLATAIAAMQAQLTQLQDDLDALERAASSIIIIIIIMAGKTALL